MVGNVCVYLHATVFMNAIWYQWFYTCIAWSKLSATGKVIWIIPMILYMYGLEQVKCHAESDMKDWQCWLWPLLLLVLVDIMRLAITWMLRVVVVGKYSIIELCIHMAICYVTQNHQTINMFKWHTWGKVTLYSKWTISFIELFYPSDAERGETYSQKVQTGQEWQPSGGHSVPQ